ncbi:MAG: agmatine deiminase family protein [Verrucomicrobia bacterium]|nr:agmatine deiminase family protein [Verrucomicrobiota bacterium]
MKPSPWRFPAEWEEQEAVWISWPLNPATWPGRLRHLQARFGELAALISRHVPVRINAAGAAHASIRKCLHHARVDPAGVELFDHPTNDVWCRDHGPIFVNARDGSGLTVTDWTYNAWGGKFPPWDLDDAVPARVAESLALPRETSRLVLEGGGIEGNGAGLLLTTEAVLLNPNRNPGWTREEIENELRRLLGVERVFWLARGIEGDDTDGHVDDFCRFHAPDKVLLAVESHPEDPNHAILEENRERLRDLRVEVRDLPMPDRLEVAGGDWRLDRLPASYANFLITNGAVIVPVFGQPVNDDRALGILRECFPGRVIEGIDARDFVYEGGAVHCLTQQQPVSGHPKETGS